MFKPELRQQHNFHPKHGVSDYITANDPPVHSRIRRLNQHKLPAAEYSFT